METFDHYITLIDMLIDSKDIAPDQREAIDAAADCMAFVQALNDMFRNNGISLPEVPDLELLQATLDGHIGELAAAVIFLSKINGLAGMNIPRVLVGIGEGLSEESSGVPTPVVRGYSRLSEKVSNMIKYSSTLSVPEEV